MQHLQLPSYWKTEFSLLDDCDKDNIRKREIVGFQCQDTDNEDKGPDRSQGDSVLLLWHIVPVVPNNLIYRDHQTPAHPGGAQCTCETNSVQWCLKLCKQQWSDICSDVVVDLNWGGWAGAVAVITGHLKQSVTGLLWKRGLYKDFVCLCENEYSYHWSLICPKLDREYYDFLQSTMLLIPTRRQHRPSASLVATKWRLFEKKDQKIRKYQNLISGGECGPSTQFIQYVRSHGKRYSKSTGIVARVPAG